jgi:hypothetical protein
MNIQQTDLATEYLREVDQRLAGLPVLQRRELIADLRAHIETERVERNLGEGELIEVLERLGSPDVIAAAAHEEAAAQGWPGPAAQPVDAGAYVWSSPPVDSGVYGWPSPPVDAAPARASTGPRRIWLIALALVGVLFAGCLLLGALLAVRSDGPSVNQDGPVEIAPPPAPDRPDPTIGR